MSTPNFGTPNYDLPIVACGLEEKLDDFEYGTIQDEIDEFNNGLNHFEVVLEPGYYQGAMLDVKQTEDYWDYDNLNELTDDDADYFYGMSKAETIKEFNDDMDKIKQFFETKSDDDRFIEIYKAAQFSNGEAIYKKVNKERS